MSTNVLSLIAGIPRPRLPRQPRKRAQLRMSTANLIAPNSSSSVTISSSSPAFLPPPPPPSSFQPPQSCVLATPNTALTFLGDSLSASAVVSAEYNVDGILVFGRRAGELHQARSGVLGVSAVELEEGRRDGDSRWSRGQGGSPGPGRIDMV